MTRWICKLLGRFEEPSAKEPLCDLTETERASILRVAPYTMTNAERMAALVNALNYIVRQGVSGDIVECGVWRGGSMMLAAIILNELGDTSRHLYLYDTFEGMTRPSDRDLTHFGFPALQWYKGDRIWCYAPLEEVEANMRTTGYPMEKIHFVKGKIEETIPVIIPETIALLRLDTDWYQSTRHELEQMYPLIPSGGVLMIDDYGHWQGARLAVDEYFTARHERVFLHRIDYTARLIVKPGGLVAGSQSSSFTAT